MGKTYINLFLIIIIAIIFKINVVAQSPPTSTDVYVNRITLVDPNIYILYWNVTDTDIVFEVHVKTDGWVLFGITPSKSMLNSDVVVSWTNSSTNKITFFDGYIPDSPMVIKDTKQDWFLLFSEMRNGYRILKFTRKLEICDSKNEDLNINDGFSLVLFAYGTSFLDGQIAYMQGYQASKVVRLLGTLNRIVDFSGDDVETIEFRINYTLNPNTTTTYYCQMYQIPEDWMRTKRHLLRFETIIDPPESTPYFHHAIFNECSNNLQNTYYASNAPLEPGVCVNDDPYYKSRWDDVINTYCNRMTLAWFIGGDLALDFPGGMAYPLGGSDYDFKYFYMEFHFHNPNRVWNLNIRSGVRLYVTKNYRPIEFSIFTSGSVFNWAGLLLPPGSMDFNFATYCRDSCLSKLYPHERIPHPDNEVTIVGSIFHAHVSAARTKTILIRNGSEIDFIFNDEFYKPMEQNYQYLKQPIVLKKGDSIKVECSYNSMNNRQFIKAGLTGFDEMCQDFIMYYPRNPSFVRCRERFELSTWEVFLNYLNSSGYINRISETLDWYSIPKSLTNVQTVSPTLVNEIQNFFATENRSQICVQENGLWTVTTNQQPVKSTEYLPTECTKEANF